MRVSFKLLAAALTIGLAAGTPPWAWAQALPAGMNRVTSVEGVDEYRLGNGLQVLLIQDDSKPTTTVNVTYRVGSKHENYGETGMAHLLEHLMFKGSPGHSTARNPRDEATSVRAPIGVASEVRSRVA